MLRHPVHLEQLDFQQGPLPRVSEHLALDLEQIGSILGLLKLNSEHLGSKRRLLRVQMLRKLRIRPLGKPEMLRHFRGLQQPP